MSFLRVWLSLPFDCPLVFRRIRPFGLTALSHFATFICSWSLLYRAPRPPSLIVFSSLLQCRSSTPTSVARPVPSTIVLHGAWSCTVLELHKFMYSQMIR